MSKKQVEEESQGRNSKQEAGGGAEAEAIHLGMLLTALSIVCHSPRDVCLLIESKTTCSGMACPLRNLGSLTLINNQGNAPLPRTHTHAHRSDFIEVPSSHVTLVCVKWKSTSEHSWVWWRMPTIPTPGTGKGQEGCKFQAILGYRESVRLAQTTVRPCL